MDVNTNYSSYVDLRKDYLSKRREYGKGYGHALSSAYKQNSFIYFVISYKLKEDDELKYLTAKFDLKDNQKYIEEYPVDSLKYFFSKINNRSYNNSITRVLAELGGINNGLYAWIKFVYNRKSYTNMDSLLNCLNQYLNQEKWLSRYPEILPKDYDVKLIPKNIPGWYVDETWSYYPHTKVYVDLFKYWDMFQKYAEDLRTLGDERYYFRKINERLSKSRISCDYELLLKTLSYYKNYEGLNITKSIQLLTDYWGMCEQMRIDKYKKYPKYLSSIHDITTAKYERYKQEYSERDFSEKVRLEYECDLKSSFDSEVIVDKETNKTEIAKRYYSVVVPKVPQDLKDEGSKLDHCVGSYIDRVISGRSYICFLRFADVKNQSLVTFEITDSRITQIKGKHNREPYQTEIDAIKEFAEKFDLKYDYQDN